MHYLIVITIIAVVVRIQFRFFVDTNRRINAFLRIFPKNSRYNLSKEKLIKKINSANDDVLDEMLTTAGFDCEKYLYSQVSAEGEEIPYFRREQIRKTLINSLSNGISVNHDNETLKTIVGSINDYLKNNKSVSDFHLMKDIVDRNCDAKEEEISTQIPIPLYMGLVGTMTGILIGILYLWWSGGIGGLLTGTGSGADGVEALLGGVAMAMISSILGIVLTTLGSYKFKTAKSVVESNKHAFLSWIQARLLPTLSDNVVGAIREMTSNLTEFNEAFSSNIGNLDDALGKMYESHRLQTQLLEAVKQIADKDLTMQNLHLYNALKNSTAEIETLTEFLHNTNEYLINVRILNEKLDSYEKRTQFIEYASKFYAKHEIWLTEHIEEANRAIKDAVNQYNNTMSDSLGKIQESLEVQMQNFGGVIQKNGETFANTLAEQQQILQSKMQETSQLVEELKNLTAVKESIAKLEKAATAQNDKTDKLSKEIRNLAEMKINHGASRPTKTPLWMKLSIILGMGALILILLLFIFLFVSALLGKSYFFIR